MPSDASEIGGITPGQRVVDMLGGVKRTARLANNSPKSVYRWLQATTNGGGGGLIPLPAQRRLVRNAKAEGIALAFEDFAPRAGEVVK